MNIRCIASIFFALLLPACVFNEPLMSKDALVEFDEPQTTLISSAYRLADSLVTSSSGAGLEAERVVVTSFADINNLTRSSTLGRMLAEHVGSRLAQKGMNVAELRMMTDSVLIREHSGELVLSRDTRKLAANIDASVFVTGTYAHLHDNLFSVSVRLVRGKDGVILASADETVKL